MDFFSVPRCFGLDTEDTEKKFFLFIDRATKFAVARPVPTTTTERDFVALLTPFLYEYQPKSIVSDADPIFGEILKGLFEKMGCAWFKASGGHPQTDGITERAIRTVKNILKRSQGRYINGTDIAVFQAVAEYNTAPDSLTGFSPMEKKTGNFCYFAVSADEDPEEKILRTIG